MAVICIPAKDLHCTQSEKEQMVNRDNKKRKAIKRRNGKKRLGRKFKRKPRRAFFSLSTPIPDHQGSLGHLWKALESNGLGLRGLNSLLLTGDRGAKESVGKWVPCCGY